MFRYTLTSMLLLWLLDSSTHAAVEFYVSPGGSDANPGTRDLPFATLDHARQAVASRADRSEPVTVFLAGGTYYLPDTLVFQANDSGTREGPGHIYCAVRPNPCDQRGTETPAQLVCL